MHDGLRVFLARNHIRIVLADHNVESFLIRLGQNPGIMQVRRGHFIELWTPHINVLALSVKFLRLAKCVEVENLAGTETTGGIPTAIVGRDIVIHEHFFEVVRAKPPVHAQVQREIGSHNLPPSIRHVACAIHVTHQCVNQRHAGHALLPLVDDLHVRLPVVVVPVVDAVPVERLAALVDEPEFVEVAPEQLVHKFVDGFGDLGGLHLHFVVLGCEVSLSDRQAAVGEPGGDFTRILGSEEVVPGVKVVID